MSLMNPGILMSEWCFLKGSQRSSHGNIMENHEILSLPKNGRSASRLQFYNINLQTSRQMKFGGCGNLSTRLVDNCKLPAVTTLVVHISTPPTPNGTIYFVVKILLTDVDNRTRTVERMVLECWCVYLLKHLHCDLIIYAFQSVWSIPIANLVFVRGTNVKH